MDVFMCCNGMPSNRARISPMWAIGTPTLPTSPRADFASRGDGPNPEVAIRLSMVEHGTVTADVSALVVVILVVCVLSLITRWVFKPSRPRTGPVVDATESTDLGMLDVLAADLSRA